MPVTISAKKKLRQDAKRRKQNSIVKTVLKNTIKSYKRNPNASSLSKVFSLLDNAKKKKILHANKVARLKARLSKLLKKKPVAAIPKTKTKSAKKSTKKIRPKKTS